MTTDSRRHYVETVLALYRRTPTTRGRSRPADRKLAETLFEQAVSLQTIQAALLYGAARRSIRPADAPPLNQIASLHYFLPVIEEIQQTPADPVYLEYLRFALQRQAQLQPQRT